MPMKGKRKKRNEEKKFDLSLEFGPYRHNFSRNGRQVLLAGQKGHVAVVDWHSYKMVTEIKVGERIYDVTQLFDESMFAVAQKRKVKIYDSQGIELHELRKHVTPYSLTYLPYHFLLCSVGRTGYLNYTDVSTGDDVANLRSKKGACHVMEHNPWNAVVHLGHQNGSVSLWSPTINEPLVKIHCHNGPVTSLNFDVSGNYMVSSGGDGNVSIWDIRTYKKLQTVKKRISRYHCVSLSQKNLLALAEGPRITIWEDPIKKTIATPRTEFLLQGKTINSLKFCPFEDALGVSREDGFSIIPVAGSGESNFDSLEVNPFETRSGRKNKLVRSLLDKIRPEFITLDPNDFASIRQEEKEEDEDD